MRESVELIQPRGAEPAGVVIALDRMERGKSALSAVEEVKENFGIPVVAVATLEDLVAYLAESRAYGQPSTQSRHIGNNAWDFLALNASSPASACTVALVASSGTLAAAVWRRIDLLLRCRRSAGAATSCLPPATAAPTAR